MKKIALLSLILLMGMYTFAESPVIKFEQTTYDFGKIKETDGKATYIFKFKNTGDAPLVISRVNASCGCTTPEWTKEPIAVGKSGSVTVTYNPQNRPGPFQKSITVFSNIEGGTSSLIIKGEVIPRPAVN